MPYIPGADDVDAFEGRLSGRKPKVKVAGSVLCVAFADISKVSVSVILEMTVPSGIPVPEIVIPTNNLRVLPEFNSMVASPLLTSQSVSVSDIGLSVLVANLFARSCEYALSMNLDCCVERMYLFSLGKPLVTSIWVVSHEGP